MKRTQFRIVASLGAVFGIALATPASAQFFGPPGPCEKGELEKVASKYLEAQETGNPGVMPFGGEWLNYQENSEVASMFGGILAKPLKIAWSRVHYDTDECKFMAEIIVTDKEHPYVLATQINVRNGTLGAVNTIITQPKDWLFDADHTLYYASHEDWSEIPPEKRNTRAELIAAADAYLDYFDDKSVKVPWGTPCARLEGSVYTGKGKPDDSCDVGVPNGVKLVDRQYVVDESTGTVDVFLRFGNSGGAVDSHLFRIEDGKIRYVHTVTNCGERENCGFGPFKDMIAKNPGMWPKLDD